MICSNVLGLSNELYTLLVAVILFGIESAVF